jgi:nucleotide-binding universal stress UspA family protein
MVRLVPRTIVVGVDVRTDAPGILDATFALGETVAARVVVVHVVGQPHDRAVDAAALSQIVDASRRRVGARLPSDEVLLVGGDPAARLREVAASELADLIVVGRGGGDGAGGSGPVTRALLTAADRPVLTVCGAGVGQLRPQPAVFAAV